MSPFLLFGGVLIFIIAIFALVLKARKKRMAENWKGTLVDKKIIISHRTSNDHRYTENTYYLYIDLTDGTRKNINVSKKLYDELNVGNKLEKQVGKYDPVKV